MARSEDEYSTIRVALTTREPSELFRKYAERKHPSLPKLVERRQPSDVLEEGFLREDFAAYAQCCAVIREDAQEFTNGGVHVLTIDCRHQ
jgi:hypothetical protein